MTLLVWLALGRLIIWSIQVNGLTRGLFSVHPKLEELRECSFCLGVWVMVPFAWALGINLLEPIYIPILSEVLAGLVGSFGLHLAEIGWRTKWGVTDLGEY